MKLWDIVGILFWWEVHSYSVISNKMKTTEYCVCSHCLLQVQSRSSSEDLNVYFSFKIEFDWKLFSFYPTYKIFLEMKCWFIENWRQSQPMTKSIINVYILIFVLLFTKGKTARREGKYISVCYCRWKKPQIKASDLANDQKTFWANGLSGFGIQSDSLRSVDPNCTCQNRSTERGCNAD